MPDTHSFGTRLRGFRKRAGLNQEELAEKIGVHLNTVSRWENEDDAPKMASLRKIAQALNVSEAELLNNAPAERWVLQLIIADSKKEYFIDMTKNMPCVASLAGNPYGATLELSGKWETFADDDLFLDLIEQLMNSRETLLLMRDKMSNNWKSI